MSKLALSITNSEINASAAIAGTKISPDFGSQAISTTGTGSTLGRLTISNVNPFITLTDTNNDSDFSIRGASGNFIIRDDTNGAARLTVDSSGNVGIGTTSPRSISGYQGITLNHATHGGFVQFRDDETNTSNVLGGSSSLNLSTQTSIPIIFNTADTERMRIDSSGNVGIGTSSPQTDLHITDTSANPTIRLSSAANGLTELQFGDANDTVRGNIVYRNGTAGDALCFNGYNNTERMRIDSSGNVGIGTTSPNVLGNDAQHTILSVIETSGTRRGQIELGDNQNVDGGGIGDIHFVGHYQSGSHKDMACIKAVSSGSTSGKRGSYLAFETKTDNVGIAERMRINSSGHVLVATTSDSIYNDTSGGGLNLKADGQFVIKKEATSSADPLVWLNDTGQTTNKSIVLAQDGSEKAYFGLAGNDLTIVTGSNFLRFSSSGNLGINQEATRELSVHSPNNNNALIHFTNDDTGETASDGILVGLNGNEDMIISHQESSKNIKILNGGAERVRVDGDGHVGVGNTVPYSSDWGSASNTKFLAVTGTQYAVLSLEGPGVSGSNHRVDQGVGDNVFYMAYNNTDNQHNLRLFLDNGNFQVERGHLVMEAAGAGIDFQHGGAIGTAANILDDYEEGTWTPSLSEGGNLVSLTTTQGRYVKIGAMVYAFWRVDLSTTSASGHLIMTNFPFTNSSTTPATGGTAKDYQNYDIEDGPIYHMPNNQSSLQFYKNSGQNFNANNGSGKSFRGCTIFSTA